ncbi:unnamed protein product, partial [Musa acuminata var. zebrina]
KRSISSSVSDAKEERASHTTYWLVSIGGIQRRKRRRGEDQNDPNQMGNEGRMVGRRYRGFNEEMRRFSKGFKDHAINDLKSLSTRLIDMLYHSNTKIQSLGLGSYDVFNQSILNF